MRAQLAIINGNWLSLDDLLAVNNNNINAQMQVIPSRNGFDLSNFNHFQTLQTAAEAYYYLGYAVIPLLGDLDPDRPKVAARPWSAYQQRLATVSEINDWFSPQAGAAALGIVTGRISRLVVLDFDSAELFADFRRRFPDLLETHTVQSAGRGLPHLYFHLPSHLRLASHKRSGVDLLSDGRYVVAPPTTINGQAYRITRGGMPRPLTEHDIDRLQSFLTAAQSISSSPTPLSSVGEGLRPSRALPNDLIDDKTPAPLSPAYEGESVKKLPTRANLHALYQYWRSQAGRNEALFRTALYARDNGLDETLTRRALTSLHISAPLSVNGEGSGVRFSSIEPQAMRQREAHATIRSAFSRPPRIHNVNVGKGLRPFRDGETGLPNSIREALMQRKLTFVLRTFEALLQAGFRPGKGFTADEAIQILKGIVGRDSVYNALNALAPNGLPFFPQRSPSALPPASSEAATPGQSLKTKKCFFVTEKKSGIKKRGTRERRFKFPKIDDLCKQLGVKPSGSDPITRDDLISASRTRMALHRELIKRRPAEYSRRWLANRLGVSRRTLDTYNHLIPIHSRATYHEINLSWTNLDTLLTDEALAGAFIETLTGKKYPALRAIAAHLLAKGTYIRLKQRAANLYWYGSDDPPPHILPTSVGTRHAVSAPHVPTSVPSPSLGKGLRPSLAPALNSPAPTTPDEPRRGAPRCAPLLNLPAMPSVSFGEALVPFSMQWRGARGDDASVGEGLRPSLVPTPLSVNQEGLGVRFSSPSPVYGLSAHEPAKVADGSGWGLTPDQQESLAQTIYTRVNASIDGTTRHLSLNNARKLVRAYSEKHIHFALQRLSQRTNLANPTGFFVTVLRSSVRQM